MVTIIDRKPTRQVKLRGWSLISVIGALSVSAIVLGVCVPFYLASHKLVERNTDQMQARDLARELTSRFREDVRAARTVVVSGAGSALDLTPASNRSRVSYRWAPGNLVRNVRKQVGVSEHMVYTAPLREVRFRRDGKAVTAVFEFSAPKRAPGRPLTIQTTASPRVEQ